MSTCAKCKCTVFLWGKNVHRDAYKGKGNEKNNFIFGTLVDGVKKMMGVIKCLLFVSRNLYSK